ncbi:hypothetical protein V3C99_012265 [Haemonchus contortus]
MGHRKDRKGNPSNRGGAAGGVANRLNTLAVKAESAIGDQLLPGRHPCNCQARIHALVRNCMGCGKIVCVQEGSGPCFFCGTLVCTKEEKEILDRGSRKSAELYSQLMGTMKGKNSNFKELSLSTVGAEFQKATQFRNKLLAADADSERRTKVNDLESDYSSIENSPYLTAEERQAIIQRRLELQEIKERRKRNIVINLNVSDVTVSEGIQDVGSNQSCDPMIESILEKSEERRRAADATQNSAVDAHWIPKGFVPKYDETLGARFESNADEFADVDALCVMNEELGRLEVERRGYTITVPQPCASLAACGFIRYVRWLEDIHLKGPVFICSTVSSTSSSDVNDFIEKYCHGDSPGNQIDYSSASILGRVYIEDCITFTEFEREYGEAVYGEGDFVLMFSAYEPMTVPIPYIPKAPLFQLEKEIMRIVRPMFS